MEVDFLTFDQAEELAARHGTPLLVISAAKLKENYLTLQDSLPNVDLYFAVKANPHRAVVKAINSIGGRFDISSVGEFELTRRLKVTSDRLVYTQPIKKQEEIEYLYRNGVDLFVYDNEEEILKISRAAPGARVLVRIATANPHCVVNLNYKFGAEPKEAEGLIEKAASAGLTVSGIAFHVGSQSESYYAYVDTILTCKKIYDLMAAKGIKMDVLDIGGGFPVKYLENIMPIHTFCEPINDALNNYFMGTRVIAEPGRVICGDAAVLVSRVVGKSRRNAVQWYYIDDGLYNSFSGKVYDHADYEIVSKRTENPSRCVLAGPTCDSFDVISSDIVLPELSIGDLLLVPSMGAYTNVSATEFNLLPKAKIITID